MRFCVSEPVRRWWIRTVSGFDQHEFYYKSPQEMYELFKHCPDAVRESLKIAERCHINIKLDQMLLPHYEVPGGQEADGYLEKLCSGRHAASLWR